MADTKDLLLVQDSDNVKYPLIQQEFNLCEREEEPIPSILDREQIQLSANRHMMLVRHHEKLHWCGYVPVDEKDWTRIERQVRTICNVRISFADYGNQFITWMARNQQGRLKQPTALKILLPGEGFDFWVGFDTMRNDNSPLVDVAEVRELLYGFENIIWRVKRNEITIPVSPPHVDDLGF